MFWIIFFGLNNSYFNRIFYDSGKCFLPAVQYPYPVRVPASVVTIKDGTLISKSHISVPLKHVSSTASITRALNKKVTNREMRSPPSELHPDSESNPFSEMLRRLRISYEKCPKCMQRYWKKTQDCLICFENTITYKSYLTCSCDNNFALKEWI